MVLGMNRKFVMQDTLTLQLQTKEKLREQIKQQLEKQTTSFDKVEKDAQALLQRALHAGRKITVQHAQHKQISPQSLCTPASNSFLHDILVLALLRTRSVRNKQETCCGQTLRCVYCHTTQHWKSSMTLVTCCSPSMCEVVINFACGVPDCMQSAEGKCLWIDEGGQRVQHSRAHHKTHRR